MRLFLASLACLSLSASLAEASTREAEVAPAQEPQSYSSSEVPPGSTELEPDPEYLLEKPLTFGATLGAPSYVFSISADSAAAAGEKRHVDYSPAPGYEISLSAGYGDFALTWKRPAPASAGNREKYGHTTYDDQRLEFAAESFAGSLFHQKYNGFYTDLNGHTNYVRSEFGETGPAAEPAAPSGPADIHKRQDINARHVGIVGYYAIPFLAEDTQSFLLSFRSGPAKPRAGFGMDLITGGSYNFARLSADRPFIPEKRRETFGPGASLQGISMHSLTASAGLASAYVFEGRKTVLDGLLLLGLGAQSQETDFSGERSSRIAFVNSVHLKLGVSHKGETHSLGLHMAVDNWSAKARNVRFNSSNLALEMGYGIAI